MEMCDKALRHLPHTKIRDLVSRRPYLHAPYSVRVEESIENYELNNNPIHMDNNWDLSSWDHGTMGMQKEYRHHEAF
jgi:hypothetical protein